MGGAEPEVSAFIAPPLGVARGSEPSPARKSSFLFLSTRLLRIAIAPVIAGLSPSPELAVRAAFSFRKKKAPASLLDIALARVSLAGDL